MDNFECHIYIHIYIYRGIKESSAQSCGQATGAVSCAAGGGVTRTGSRWGGKDTGCSVPSAGTGGWRWETLPGTGKDSYRPVRNCISAVPSETRLT